MHKNRILIQKRKEFINIIFILSVIFFVNACSTNIDPKIQQHQQVVMQQFNTLVKEEHNYICKAKFFSPQSNYKKAKAQGKVTNDGTVTFVFDFKDYPNNVNVDCISQSYTWCDDDFYDKFLKRHHTSIKIDGNRIKPVHDKYHYDFYDAQIKILDVKGNQVDIYMNGTIEQRDHINLTMNCSNPLKQVQQTEKIKTFKSSPYSDAVLLKKLDKLLNDKPSIQKYNAIKKLIEYGVYISEKSLYKSLGVASKSNSADYRVFKLLQKNSNMSDKEVFSPKLTSKFFDDEDDKYRMVEYCIDDIVYGTSEYEKMNGYAFVEYFAKLGIFNKELIRILKQNLSNTSSLKFPKDIKKKLYKSVFTNGEENDLINLALYNIMSDPEIVLPYLKQVINSSNRNLTKQMNIFLIKYLNIKPYKLNMINGYFDKNDYTLLEKNRYNKKSYSYKYINPQTYFPEFYTTLQAFIKKSTPDKVTAELYSYITEHNFTTINQASKQKILSVLNTKNTAKKAQAQEYHQILAKMIHEKDHRGALFYLKKGAIGDPVLMIDALKNNMDDVAQILALQDIHFDPKSVIEKSLELKKYKFISFLLNHNKLPKKILPSYLYTLVRINTQPALNLADEMEKYGADTAKALLIAQEYNDEKTLKRIVKRYPTNQNIELLDKYNKEQQRLAKKRKEVAKQAAIQRQKEEELLKKAYMAHKNIGEKVCKDGRVALFLNITMSGYVENIQGDKIQIRIADTKGTTPYYNGVSLYPNKIIWDKYYEWRKCD